VLDKLREQGPAVYMSRYDFWLSSRYDTVRAAAGDWQTYTSAQGVALTPEFNAKIAGSVLATDPPEHDALRAVLSDKLAPRALGETRASIRGTPIGSCPRWSSVAASTVLSTWPGRSCRCGGSGKSRTWRRTT